MLRHGIAIGVIAIAAALVGALPASADHTTVNATVTIRQGDKEVASGTFATGCSATNCQVVVRLAKRDVGRVSRWCGTTSFSVTLDAGLPANAAVGPEACAGGGSWYATVLVSRNGVHAEDVSVQVDVLPFL